MVDATDIYTTFPGSKIFTSACTDTLRIVSILSLESNDVTKPQNKKSLSTTFYERVVFLWRFFYMVCIKGFTPPVFDILPYTVWRLLSLIIYLYRLYLVPYWLRFTGYLKYASWKDIGFKQSCLEEEDIIPLKTGSLSKESQLSLVNFGDEKYELFVSTLVSMSTHLSPHSQSPGNPITHHGCPGNFFDHLVGVFKILAAWKQPRFVVRAGMFHSVYGTFDYRFSLFDLREGRASLSSLIGPASEEIAFAICTSDRLGLLWDLMKAMYGKEYVQNLSKFGSSTAASPANSSEAATADKDGNPLTELKGRLTSDGFPVRNHITQQVHVLPAEFFAHFVIVMVADFMEQGALIVGSTDLDICLFQFLRFRFYSDLIRFVKPFLRVSPPVWEKYLGDNTYIEPLREDVLAFKKLWRVCMRRGDRWASDAISAEDRALLEEMVRKYPYIPEPTIALACAIKVGETSKSGESRAVLAARGLQLLEEWGMLTVKSSDKSGSFSIKEVLHLLQKLL